MEQIYKNSTIKIAYNDITERAEIKSKTGDVNSIAMIHFKTNEMGCWDKFRCFWLKNFSWNWIEVNSGTPGSTQLVNMASISKRLGITPQEIHDFNQAGTLYNQICLKYESSAAQTKILGPEVKPILPEPEVLSDERILSIVKFREMTSKYTLTLQEIQAISSRIMVYCQVQGRPDGLSETYRSIQYGSHGLFAVNGNCLTAADLYSVLLYLVLTDRLSFVADAFRGGGNLFVGTDLKEKNNRKFDLDQGASELYSFYNKEELLRLEIKS